MVGSYHRRGHARSSVHGYPGRKAPIQVPGLILNVDPDDDDADSDGDALIDRWDNCPFTSNPGWADTDSEGIGDACDPG